MEIIFTTPRLTARKWAIEEAPELHDIYCDPEVTRYLGRANIEDRSLDKTTQRLKQILERDMKTPGLGFWCLEANEDGRILGSVLLKQLDDREEVEVGYHLRRDEWGNGYATEAARGAVRHGFEVIGLPRIVAVSFAENIASINVIRKLGFQYGGVEWIYGYDLEYYFANDLPIECMEV
jgi:RimJ/RimL family protein N-acetyltransferase